MIVASVIVKSNLVKFILVFFFNGQVHVFAEVTVMILISGIISFVKLYLQPKM